MLDSGARTDAAIAAEATAAAKGLGWTRDEAAKGKWLVAMFDGPPGRRLSLYRPPSAVLTLEVQAGVACVGDDGL